MFAQEPPAPSAASLHAQESRKNWQIAESNAFVQTVLGSASSSFSCPRHADSPTSMSSYSTVGSEAELREAVGFMRRFLQEGRQDSTEKAKFLGCVDIYNANTNKQKSKRLMDQTYNPSVIRDTLRLLLPATSSSVAMEREAALSRMTKLIGTITSHCITRGMKDFRIGQLVGSMTLCCRDSSEGVRQWAADGLHHLYALILTQKGITMTYDSQEYLDLLKEWEEEKIFWLAWFSDVSDTTMIFKKCLRPDDQTDFILTSIRAMVDESIHSKKAAIQMLKAMLREPIPNLVKIPKAVKFIYHCMEHISDASARQEIYRYLRLLGNTNAQELVKALLGCSLQCDSTASAMWHAITCFSELAKKILTELQNTMQEKPLNPDEPDIRAALQPLAATAALHDLLRHPSPACRQELKAMYPTLSIALLCQISYTLHFTPQEIDIYWRTCIQQNIPTPPVPFRSALRTFRSLIRRVGDGDQTLIMNDRRGSELLLHRETHQKGITLFARALFRNQGCFNLLPFLVDILDNKEDTKHITVMTFLVELLHQQTFEGDDESLIIRQLSKQLMAARCELRSLALDGMLYLADYPEKVVKLEPALPDILARLKEANREINVKALKLLPSLLRSLQNNEASSLTIDVAARVLPLFDDACWDALKRIDAYMKSFIQLLIHDSDQWGFCKSLVKRYKEHGENILVDQTLVYLENPRRSLRDAAMKLLEIFAQETRSRETLCAIATVLNLARLTNKPSNMYLVASDIMGAMGRTSTESFIGRCFSRFRTMCRK
ncbi:maestro heat-like repeat-containing protein family member 7 isoform X2 [Hemicordylus capensis]|uniref:maestro heat-like repeat-containing protein family member 7 isoform X2 n=1 Tax=Hemicordylus capensis TaxID=884348 RepID=UPI00230222CC|nr:maestro heat-like repeat-containing protein family member 7 isoform X2 [Hemicordylus capensis]